MDIIKGNEKYIHYAVEIIALTSTVIYITRKNRALEDRVDALTRSIEQQTQLLERILKRPSAANHAASNTVVKDAIAELEQQLSTVSKTVEATRNLCVSKEYLQEQLPLMVNALITSSSQAPPSVLTSAPLEEKPVEDGETLMLE